MKTRTQIQRCENGGPWLLLATCPDETDARESLDRRGVQPAGEYPEVWIDDPKVYHHAQVDAVRYRLVNENAGAWITKGR